MVGQKDGMQCIVIQRMVAELNFPVEIVVCPTVRESDGLAMSSRNVYLTPPERRAAPVLYRSLQAAQSAFNCGERDAERLRKTVLDVLHTESILKPQVHFRRVTGPVHVLRFFNTKPRCRVHCVFLLT